MGTYYHVYAEVKIDDKWCNLNPIIKKEDGSYGITTITWGQSRFYETWLHLEEHRIQGGLPEDCSEELRSVFHEDLDATADFLWKEQTYRDYYNSTMFVCDFTDAILNHTKKERPHKYRGYVSKYAIASFECGEEDSINYWLTEQDYEKLGKDAQKEYAYYEWDNWDDVYQFLYAIRERVYNLLDWFDYDYNDCRASNVRLICWMA